MINYSINGCVLNMQLHWVNNFMGSIKNHVFTFHDIKRYFVWLQPHSQNKWYYDSYIGSYLKAVRVIAKIWNSILCFYSSYSCNQKDNSTYNHCLYMAQTMLNFADGSYCCKIILVWLGSSLSTVIHRC